MSEGFYGMYQGQVVNNADPEGLNRIQCTCPQVFGNLTIATDWATPCYPPGWSSVIVPPHHPVGVYDFGLDVAPSSVDNHPPTFSTPPIGAGVWLAFVGGNTDYPIWMGTWQ